MIPLAAAYISFGYSEVFQLFKYNIYYNYRRPAFGTFLQTVLFSKLRWDKQILEKHLHQHLVKNDFEEITN